MHDVCRLHKYKDLMALKMYDLAGEDSNLRFSPYCWRVKLACIHKGLELQTIPWRYADKQRIAFSGQGAVPVLIDGDHVVVDSWRIAEYLEEKYPKKEPLFSSKNRALAFFVKQWTEKAIQPAMMRGIILDMIPKLHRGDRDYFRRTREERYGMRLEEFAGNQREQIEKVKTALEPLRVALDSFTFLGGETPCFADYIVFSSFKWMGSFAPLDFIAAGDPIRNWLGRLERVAQNHQLKAGL